MVKIELGAEKSVSGYSYSWKNLSVWNRTTVAKSQTAEKSNRILKNVSGVVCSGQLLAIMGASGAGKSTLLNTLTFRNGTKLGVSGDRKINGMPVDAEALQSISAYIEQDSLVLECLTVREHLVLQALLRMPSYTPLSVRMNRVEELIQEFGLSKCANTRIGSPGRRKGISGGEIRRLTFASEVLTDPALLFCDEPTSGLDSNMSQNVVEMLKKLAARGKTILCTIHQPSSQTFAMFDQILLLAEGRVAFMGHASEAHNFFAYQGYPCPHNFCPADYYIQTLAVTAGDEDACRNRINDFCNYFEKIGDHAQDQDINQNVTNSKDSVLVPMPVEKEGSRGKPRKVSWINQFRAVFWRSWICNIRDPTYLRAKFVQMMLMSFTIGIVFFGQEFNSDGVQNINGATFNLMMNLSFGHALAAVYVFCSELNLFLREHMKGTYRADVYFLAKTLAEVPFFVLFPFLTVCIVYFMIGLQLNLEAFLYTSLVFILVTNCAVSLGYFVSCLSSNGSMAATLSPALIHPLVLVGGLFLSSRSVPSYLIWAKYLSWFHYGNEALTVVQWKNVGSIYCTDPGNSNCIPDGAALLQHMDFKEENLWFDIGALVGLLIFFRVLAYLALFKKTLVARP